VFNFRSHAKSFAKAVSWRTLNAAFSFSAAFAATGSAKAAVGFAAFEFVTKTFLMYGHERAFEFATVKFATK